MHGSKTILQEVSHSKALYLLGTCDDNPVSTIFKKCHVRVMRPGDEEVTDDGSRDSNDFHCSYVFLSSFIAGNPPTLNHLTI